MVPALGAAIGLELRKLVKRRLNPAGLASVAQAVANLHDVLKAGIVCGEAFEEVADCDLAVILAGELSFFASLDQILFFAKQLYLLTVQQWE